MAITKSYGGGLTIVFNQRGIDQLLESEDGPLAKFILSRVIIGTRVAKRYCPVGTYPPGSGRTGGTLRASITYALGQDMEGIFGMIGTNVHYARFVEFGTRFMDAQPYLRPGLQAAMDF